MSDHGFGPIAWYVNFNVWLLERGDLALQDSLYVRQKRWFYEHGVTPEWFYQRMVRWGLAGQRVSRFRGKQLNPAGAAGAVGLPVATARRLVADPRLCARELRPDLRQRPGPAAPGLRRPGGRPPAPRGPQGRAARDSPPRDRPTAGRAGLRARGAVPRAAGRARPGFDRRHRRLEVPDDRPARLHDQPAHLPRVRPDRRPPDGGRPDRRRPAVPAGGDPRAGVVARYRPDDPPPARRACPRRHGRPRPERDP